MNHFLEVKGKKMKKQFNTLEAVEIFLSGKKIRRTVWDTNDFVELKTDGSYQFISNPKNQKGKILEISETSELLTPSKSLEKFGFNPEKMWEVIETPVQSQKINISLNTRIDERI